VIRALFSYLSKNQVIAAILFLGIVFLIFLLREILLAIFVAYIIVAALIPAVEFLRRRGLPKSLAVILTFFVTLILMVLLIAPLIPFLVSQIQQLSKSFPVYLNEAAGIIGIKLDFREVTQIVTPQQLGENAFALAGGVFGGFFSIVTAVALSFYLLFDYEKIKKGIANFFPRTHRERVEGTVERVNDKLGAWLRGQFLLSLAIGLLTWITLTVLHMPFALPLAVLAGLFEIVPTVGPILSAIPAIVVALSMSFNMAAIIVVAYIFIQLVENNLFVPRIMQRAVGLNPVIVIIGVIVGDKLLGIPGALLSVPFISLLVLISKDVEEFFE
jgi:predicted PurR-regulated permease PerM